MAYGMTENLGLAALRGDEWLQHPGSVGRGFRDTEIRVLDDRRRSLAAPGELGEIYLRAPMNDSVPLHRRRATAAADTRTVSRRPATSAISTTDGYLYIADRRTDMIVTGGANVFPAEVEIALIDHPDIADVVVIGIADPNSGAGASTPSCSRGTQRNPPTEQAGDRVRQGSARGYKVPKTVEFVDEIPRTAATKVNRSAMVAARGG